MKDGITQRKNLSLLTEGGRTLTLGQILQVTDNLDRTFDMEMDVRKEHFLSHFPMKMSAACMVIVFKGSVKFSVNFRDFVASENSCLIVTEGTIVENVLFEEGSRIIFLAFSQKELSGPNVPSQRNLYRFYALQVAIVKLLPLHLEMMKTAYDMLRTVMSDPSFGVNREGTAFSCLALMANIIMQVSANQPELSNKTTRRDEIVARFLQCVADNYRTHRELSFYANQLCLSLKYMSHVVFEQTGRHPTQWIKDYVILDAKTMLRSRRYTVQQVADELNFPNQSFFGKYFKEAVGVSPKKWK